MEAALDLEVVHDIRSEMRSAKPTESDYEPESREAVSSKEVNAEINW